MKKLAIAFLASSMVVGSYFVAETIHLRGQTLGVLQVQAIPSPTLPAIVASSGATVTLTTAQSGQTFAFDRASGVVYTLPIPAAGLNYRFINTVAQTSASNEVDTALTTSVTLFMQGFMLVSGTTTMGFAGVPTTSVAIKTNDTTTGGLIGGDFTCLGLSATLWQCDGYLVGSGTVATPFVTSD